MFIRIHEASTRDRSTLVSRRETMQNSFRRVATSYRLSAPPDESAVGFDEDIRRLSPTLAQIAALALEQVDEALRRMRETDPPPSRPGPSSDVRSLLEEFASLRDEVHRLVGACRPNDEAADAALSAFTRIEEKVLSMPATHSAPSSVLAGLAGLTSCVQTVRLNTVAAATTLHSIAVTSNGALTVECLDAPI